MAEESSRCLISSILDRSLSGCSSFDISEALSALRRDLKPVLGLPSAKDWDDFEEIFGKQAKLLQSAEFGGSSGEEEDGVSSATNEPSGFSDELLRAAAWSASVEARVKAASRLRRKAHSVVQRKQRDDQHTLARVRSLLERAVEIAPFDSRNLVLTYFFIMLFLNLHLQLYHLHLKKKSSLSHTVNQRQGAAAEALRKVAESEADLTQVEALLRRAVTAAMCASNVVANDSVGREWRMLEAGDKALRSLALLLCQEGARKIPDTKREKETARMLQLMGFDFRLSKEVSR
jgi:hypothetical protein